MKAAAGRPGDVEARVLSEAGLSADDLVGHRRVQGARRPLRFQPADGRAASGTDARGPFLELRFTLEPGCYATTVLREITKRAE
jgi:tRNA(Glu) U13 pseudouridine synthase TruD